MHGFFPLGFRIQIDSNLLKTQGKKSMHYSCTCSCTWGKKSMHLFMHLGKKSCTYSCTLSCTREKVQIRKFMHLFMRRSNFQIRKSQSGIHTGFTARDKSREGWAGQPQANRSARLKTGYQRTIDDSGIPCYLESWLSLTRWQPQKVKTCFVTKSVRFCRSELSI